MRPLPLRAPTAFTGSRKTLAFLFFLPLLLLCSASTAQADAVVITGGSIGTPLGLGNFSMTPTAPGFSFTGAHMGAPRPQICGPCNPGQQLGGVIPVNLTVSFSLTYNGVNYLPGGPGLGYVVISSGNVITLDQLTIPLDLSPVSAPFSFVGGISVFSRDPSLPSFHLELSGSGIATFTFSGSGFNIRSQASFVFAPPQPMPEPATMILLATGLSGVIAAKARRRRRKV